MSVRRLDPDQPGDFAFSPDNLEWAKAAIGKFPEGKQASAVLPLLWRAQEQHDGWLPEPAIRYVAGMLGMAEIRVLEVATFYTMFQLSPVGAKAHIQVCGTTPCMLRGSQELVDVCKRRINAKAHHLSEDGDFSWEEVECLGACVNAPLVQVDKDVYEDLTPESFEQVLDAFARGERPEPGPKVDRQFSAPVGGPTSLNTPGLYNGHDAGGDDAVAAAALDASKGQAGAAAEISDGGKPAGLSGPRLGMADDLKLISGVGPKLEGLLNELGIYHFDQIADWTPQTVAWVDNYLSFKGRIDREDWISQAIKLAGGG